MTAPETAPTATTEAESDVSPADEAWDAFLALFMQYRPRMFEIHAEYELKPPPVAMALKVIDDPTPMGKIANHLCCDGSTVTWIVDRLEERGLVERQSDPRDRRVRLVALTDEGRRIRNEISAKLSQAPPGISGLSEEDQLMLRDILRRAVQAPADA